MLFNSYIFILLFLPITLLGYYGLNKLKQEKLATAFLVAMSLWFYGYNNINYLYILIVSVLLNFILVHFMRQISGWKRKLLFIAGVFLNLGILFYFKYYDFFIENMNQIFKSDIKFLNIALPLGISFYTFQQLSYVIDSYKGECEEYPLLEYASYVTFFPQLIAGPIVYHEELIPQFRKAENKVFNYDNFSKGIYAFTLGLAKKVLLADTFSPIAIMVFDKSAFLNTNSTIVGMIAYTLQLYFDFSGYCDMAYGIGYMFNVILPINFNSPYKADSIGDYWSRWHMTLTRFFTKYVYIPLGGSRKGAFRRNVNSLIVFVLSGLWHGAAWNFVLWGTLNGFMTIVDRYIGRYFKKIPKFIRVGIMFIYITLSNSVFRAKSFAVEKELFGFLGAWQFGDLYSPITEYFNGLLGMTVLSRITSESFVTGNIALIVYLFTAVIVAAVLLMKNTQEKVQVMQLTKKKILVIAVLFTWSVVSLSGVSEFLYFNF